MFLKKESVHFHGQKEIDTKLKNQTENVISRRFKILIIFIVGIGIVLLSKLFFTQIKQGDYYTTKLSQYNTNIFYK